MPSICKGVTFFQKNVGTNFSPQGYNVDSISGINLTLPRIIQMALYCLTVYCCCNFRNIFPVFGRSVFLDNVRKSSGRIFLGGNLLLVFRKFPNWQP